MSELLKNPFRPGAGQKPPHLAGRENEQKSFEELLKQDIVFRNLIITGLRGTGKTVLLETLKPIALKNSWLWVGADLSESASVSELSIAVRIMTDLAIITSQIVIGLDEEKKVGFNSEINKNLRQVTLNYQTLEKYFNNQPGLVSDKLKATLEWTWQFIKIKPNIKGIVFAYDEAQNMSDQAEQQQYPLSLLLDIFQSLQRKEIPFLVLFVGLPTIFPKLVTARTYSERMFQITELKNLSEKESREAIKKPIEKENCPVKFTEDSITLIVKESGGYPYFIQFMCREAYDSFLNQIASGTPNPSVPIAEIVSKLDTEFFSGRWSKITDRQRELLGIVASLDSCEGEFTAQEVVEKSGKEMSNSLINQMFSSLMTVGLLYKTRHGKYTLGIPLLAKYISRQTKSK